MKTFVTIMLCLIAAGPATAQHRGDRHRGDQQEAFAARQEGRILSLREIEKRVVPDEERRGSQYIGFDFQSPPGIYTLKFLRDGVVIWIEVDGRSGRIIGRTGK